MGFFSNHQVQSDSRPDGKTYSCASCGLYKYVRSPRMKPFGNFKRGILNIGEAPGETEDFKGKQWQGPAGQLLNKTYRRLGIDLFEDCLNINSVNCRPVDKKGNNRAPTPYEITCCRARIFRIINQVKPKCIILHGGIAVQSIIGHRWKKDLGGIFKWRGWTIPDRGLGTWICPVFHSSYVMRQENNETQTIWERDLRKAFSIVDTPFPQYADEFNPVEIVDGMRDQIALLKKLNMGSLPPDPQEVAFDIETTGLKPHNTAVHKVACISFCDNPNHAYVIPGPRVKAKNQALRDLLTNPQIGKVAANMKFEDTWMNIIYGIQTTPWVWDTMQAAHVIDNRPGITGLKFQVYVNFGLVDYDSDISSYLRSASKDGNAVNQIEKAMQDPEVFRKIKIYCGLDSLFTYRLAQIQKGIIDAG
jgi:uracil-DNA glycosylase